MTSRMERDSNPRYSYQYFGFQDRLFQPLRHPSLHASVCCTFSGILLVGELCALWNSTNTESSWKADPYKIKKILAFRFHLPRANNQQGRFRNMPAEQKRRLNELLIYISILLALRSLSLYSSFPAIHAWRTGKLWYPDRSEVFQL